jgi:hypothetical protein
MRRFVLITAALTALALPATAAAGVKSIWGPSTLPNGQSAFPVYRDLGVNDIQAVLSWDQVAPTKPANPANPNDPAYQWPAEASAIAASGFRTTLLVTQAPGWANGGLDGTHPPTNVNDYADFLTAAGKKYPRVRHWEIWGEPNRHQRWNPQGRRTAPRKYAKLLEASYKALKKASKRNIVIGGMTFTSGDVLPVDWLKNMKLPNGKPPHLDWYGHNPFSTRFPSLKGKPVFGKNRDFNDLDTLHSEVLQAYEPLNIKPKLWLSEFTIQADHPSSEFNFFVSQADQAKWIKAAYKVADSVPWIAGLGWIELLDAPLADGNRTTGLLTYELAPKPAYTAYKSAR